MNKVFQRLLIFFIGLPALIFIVYFKNFNHILFNILLFAVSIVGTNELHNIFSSTLKTQPKGFVLFLSGLTPLAALLVCTLNLPEYLIIFTYTLCVVICMTYEIFFANGKESIDFADSNSHIVTSVCILTYISFLLSFISRITMWYHSRAFLVLFLLIVYGCDSLAWLFGMLFGKGNRGFIKASPNKSIAGFIGGVATSVSICIVLHFLYKNIFPELWKMIVIGLITSIASIIGDLIESVFKRSANFKDSGTIIPGRGGLLDSVDSILLASPVFYFLCKILLGQ